ncbi:FAD-binding oxidoreductase [Flavobacterium sp. 5]|uniref:NAD(P)/FAD-dependent oxidoreductase n=1 Tax=Flavobacterium sp. 5 TaxID=2035199 RepID=UPI000C2C775A|nr:FAD-binding oxidoreductase [Flavobacterium sp. 5]PKB16828.1 glycine/D-amino acid oxidase-like deaminating enzyme [Flavobacterium sp. 5]
MKLKSNEPFWLVKNGILNSYPSVRENLETEILIVGGGITGSLIAYQCIAEGYKTILIDRREIGFGSTSATTSMLQYEIDVPLYQLIDLIGEAAAVESYRACYKSIDDLKEIVQQIKSDCGFKKKQSLYFAAFQKDVSGLKKEFEIRKKNGFLVKWLEAEEIDKKFQIKNSYGGILSEQGGSIDAFKLTHDILEYNHKKGLQIFDKTDIKNVTYKTNGVTVITEYGTTIKAKKIIYCNGFESIEIIKDDFVKLLSTYAIVGERFEDNQPYLGETLFWNTENPYKYMRTTDDNRLLIGGEDEDFVNAEKRDELLNQKSDKLVKYLKKILPNYDFRMDFVWAGTFGETKDGLPYIGKHPNFDSAYFVLGFGGNGITFSVIGMELVSKMLKNKKHPLQEYFRFRR